MIWSDMAYRHGWRYFLLGISWGYLACDDQAAVLIDGVWLHGNT